MSFVIDFGARHSYDAQTGKVNKIMNHEIDPSIIIFGASSGEVGIDPSFIQQTTHLSAFNCSIDGTRFMQYKSLINEFQSYTKNDEYVLLAETCFSFEKIGALTSIERYLPHINNDNIYHSLFMIQPDLTWKCRHIPFYKYIAASHVYYKNSVLGWKNFLKKYKDTSLGYIAIDRAWEADADEAIRSTAPFAIQLDTAIINEYVKTIQSIQKNGKKVIILLTPVYTEMLKRITDFTPLRKELALISEETGSRFLDFSIGDLCTDKTLFYNSMHLNLKGSSKFSAILADSLNNIINANRKTIN